VRPEPTKENRVFPSTLPAGRVHRRLALAAALVLASAVIFDVTLSAVLNDGRFDLRLHAGRIYGLLAASFVLIALLIENGKLCARVVEAHESERRLAQEKAAELAALNKELDAFSHLISHDLRAPLGAVAGFAKVLDEDFAERLDPEARRLLGTVRANARQMQHRVEHLLEVSRLGRQRFATERVRLDDLVRRAIEDLRIHYAGRTIEFSVGELGTAAADPALLKQAFANLIGNAVKYTRGRYPARIEVGRRPTDGTGEPAVYYVKDNGAGFDMSQSHRLFGVFQRLHTQEEFEGTGVGLAIVERVIVRHGGRIWAESRPGVGAIFYFTLQPDPAQDAGAVESRA